MVEDKFIKNIYIKYITEKSADSTFCLSVVKKKKQFVFGLFGGALSKHQKWRRNDQLKL